MPALLLLLVLILSPILLFIVKTYINYRKEIIKHSHIPGVQQFIPPQIVDMLPRSWTSSLIENRNFLWSCIFQYKEQFGLVYRAIFGHQSVIVILDPDFGRELVTKASKIFKKQQKLNKRFQLLMGDNVFTAVEHDVWRRHRTLLNPAFTDEKLSSTVAHATNKTVRELLHKINKNPTRNAGEDMSNLTIDIIGSAGFGFDFGATIRETLDSDSLAVKTQEFFEAFPSFFLAPSDFIRMNFKVGPLKTIHESNDAFKKAILTVIEKRKREGTASNDEDNDILNLLLNGSTASENSELAPLNEYELISDSFIMIVAGHETTSRTLTMALYLLATHPEIQDEAYQFLQKSVSDRELTHDDYESNLEYIHWIFDETLRLYPVAVGIVRDASTDYTFKDTFIPKGTAVFYAWNATFRDETYFPKPDEFIPSRWNEIEKKTLLYTPFGVGNRSCIGKKFAKIESVLVLAQILRNYKVHLADPTYKMDVEVVVTIRPVKPLFIRFENRN